MSRVLRQNLNWSESGLILKGEPVELRVGEGLAFGFGLPQLRAVSSHPRPSGTETEH